VSVVLPARGARRWQRCGDGHGNFHFEFVTELVSGSISPSCSGPEARWMREAQLCSHTKFSVTAILLSPDSASWPQRQTISSANRLQLGPRS